MLSIWQRGVSSSQDQERSLSHAWSCQVFFLSASLLWWTNRPPSITLDIPLFKWFVGSFLNTVFLLHPIKLQLFVLHVNKPVVIIYLFLLLRLSNNPLDLVFSDVWGPAPVLSSDGSRYYVSFLDNFSKFCWLYPISSKFDVQALFLWFQNNVERQFDRKIKILHTNGGGEFRALILHLQQCGIAHRLSCPHTHQQNGAIERKHRYIVQVGLSLLANASMPQSFWAEAFQIATFLINRLPTPVLHQITFWSSLPYTTRLSFLKIFGSLLALYKTL